VAASRTHLISISISISNNYIMLIHSVVWDLLIARRSILETASVTNAYRVPETDYVYFYDNFVKCGPILNIFFTVKFRKKPRTDRCKVL